jgi:hypothetical protein
MDPSASTTVMLVLIRCQRKTKAEFVHYDIFLIGILSRFCRKKLLRSLTLDTIIIIVIVNHYGAFWVQIR